MHQWYTKEKFGNSALEFIRSVQDHVLMDVKYSWYTNNIFGNVITEIHRMMYWNVREEKRWYWTGITKRVFNLQNKGSDCRK